MTMALKQIKIKFLCTMLRDEDVYPQGGLWLYRLVRLGLAVVFIWSGLSKLINPQSFILIIEAYGFVPGPLLWPMAIFLCLAEMAAGIGLLLDTQYALGLITGLLLLFMTVLSYGLWLGLDVDCGCFGPDDPEGQAYHSLRPALFRDIGMLASIGFLYFQRYRQSIKPQRLPSIFTFNPLRR
jgi:uncharacterized membrane protein YphA (DoxX/SURF4 family)